MNLNDQILFIQTLHVDATIKSQQSDLGTDTRYEWKQRAKSLQSVADSLEELKAHQNYTIVDDGKWITERDTQSF